jgi:urease accessory protein
MRLRLRLAVLVGGLVSVSHAVPAAAHTGHSTGGLWSGLEHPLLGVDHLFAMVTVGILAVVLGHVVVVPSAFLVAMTAGGTAGIVGVALPFGEPAIVLSVVALGAALIAGGAVHPSVAVGLVAVAGFVHGHAHGLEAPTAISPIVYVAGFVLATAVLHVSGGAAGVAIRARPAARATVGAVVLGAGVGLVAGLIQI